MIKSADAILTAWETAVGNLGRYSSATFERGPIDPQKLHDDELPAVRIVNPETAVELIDYAQRDTVLAWDAWLLTREGTVQDLIYDVEAVEDLAATDSTLSGDVRVWHVANWAIYEMPDNDLRLAVMRIETERIEG